MKSFRVLDSIDKEIARILIIEHTNFKFGLLFTPPYIDNTIKEAYTIQYDDHKIVTDLCSKALLQNYHVI